MKAIALDEEDRASLASQLINSLDVPDQKPKVLMEENAILMTHEEFHQVVKER